MMLIVKSSCCAALLHVEGMVLQHNLAVGGEPYVSNSWQSCLHSRNAYTQHSGFSAVPSPVFRPLSALQVGSQSPDKAVIWVIARQHPGGQGLGNDTAASPLGLCQQSHRHCSAAVHSRCLSRSGLSGSATVGSYAKLAPPQCLKCAITRVDTIMCSVLRQFQQPPCKVEQIGKIVLNICCGMTHNRDMGLYFHVPGESMAEWFVEGLLERLTADGAAGAGDADVTALLQSAVLYIVPNMCPDGSIRWVVIQCETTGLCAGTRHCTGHMHLGNKVATVEPLPTLVAVLAQGVNGSLVPLSVLCKAAAAGVC